MSFHADTIAKAVESGCSSFLAASWRRCLLNHRLDPDAPYASHRLEEVDLRQAQDASASTLAVACEHIDQLFHVIAGSDHAVFFADANGIVLDKRSSHQHETWARTPTQFIGLDMRESLQGTNGVGTALVEKRSLMVVAGEHFLAPYSEMTCFGAPIYGAQGDLVGCIDVSRPGPASAAGLDRVMLALVSDAARKIELALLTRAFPHARFVAAAPDRCIGAVLAVDADDVVVGATQAARSFLGLPQTNAAQPIFLDAVLERETSKHDQRLESAERAAISRVLAQHGGNISSAARTLGITRGTLYRKIDGLGIDHKARRTRLPGG